MSPFSSEDIEDTLPEENKGGTLPKVQKKEKSSVLEIVQFAVLALIIVVPIRYFVAQPFIVSGASMENTFHTNEYLIVDQVSYYFNKPQRGDVIIFRYPRDPSKYFIKRIIGIPGDTLNISGNVVTITNKENEDGVVLDETYVKSMKENSYVTETLNDREYFVMGDNRDESSDSRRWGVLQEDSIIGKAFIRLFPFNEIDLLPGEVDIGVKEITKTNE